jgi:glycosyltransferase involved in cell wall biosynthesis
MKKIAILAESPLQALLNGANGRISGGATWLPQLAIGLAEERLFEITWISFNRETESTKSTRCRGINFVSIPSKNLSLDAATGHFFSRQKLLKIIHEIRPHTVHAWGSENAYGSVLGKSEYRTVFSLQGHLKEYQRVGGLPQGHYWRFKAEIEKSFVNNADIVTAESNWAIDKLNEFYNPKMTKRVEYGIHPSFYEIEWQPDPDVPTMLFIGSITHLKGIDILVEAINHCATKNWKLYIAGDGPLLPTLRERTRGMDQIVWMGMIGWDELQKLQKKTWALVHPSRAETGPMCIKEARVVGIPVITTCHGGQSEYVQDGVNGFIFDIKNPRQLARLIDRCMSDYNLVRRLGNSTKEKDRIFFSPLKTANEFINLYHSL